LAVRGRGQEFIVLADGQKLIEGRDTEFRSGAFGLGCQVRQVSYRNLRLDADRIEPLADWPTVPEPKPYVVVCSDAGHGGYQAFPGLCRLKNGNLLAVFYAGWAHVSRPGDRRFPNGGAVAVCRSTDDGTTWGPAQIVLDTPLDDRDPSVWQCEDGTIYVSSISADWSNFKPPYDNWCYNYRVRSGDNGRTWSRPEELRIGDKREYTTWTEPRRLKSGQWLWPIYRNHGSEVTTAMLRSTDGGHTWGPPHLLDKNSKSTDEPDICQFPDGTLFCAMRPVSEPHMWHSWSRDNGRTWTRPAPLPFFGHCANLLYTREGVTLLAHRDPGMAIHWSLDQAKTWAGAVMIDPCGGAYSQMVELPDGRILIIYYSEGARSQIRAQFLRTDPSGIRSAVYLGKGR
jgi:sialidase-1